MRLNGVFLVMLTMLTGCATQPVQAPSPLANQAQYQAHLAKLATISQFNLKGRLSANTQKQGFSGSVMWQHQPATDEIAIYSPLGGQVAAIRHDETGVTLVDTKGNSVTANDAETLTEQTMGWRLPLAGLTDWALGRPSASSAVESASWDEAGRLTKLKQSGWEIEYLNYQDKQDHALPGKIFMRSEQVNLKLLVEDWKL